MKSIYLFLIIINMLFLTNCIRKGSGVLVDEEFYCTDFTQVEISEAFEYTINHGRADEYEIVVTTDDNLMEFIEVEKEGEKVSIGFTKPGSYNPTEQKVALIIPDLSKLELNGASRGTLDGFSGNALSVVISGASSLVFKNCEYTSFTLDNSGASSLNCEDCDFDNVNLIVSGASTTKLKYMTILEALLDISGASKVSLAMDSSGSVSGEISGFSQLTLYNRPAAINLDVSGFSDYEVR